ncbi:ankyrin repeat-containing domain protein [Flagelloscypha sp. PMI_526]|nr:ankyrin repeat-containing domain protein [Flagelloscypha sp. PMI_526]
MVDGALCTIPYDQDALGPPVRGATYAQAFLLLVVAGSALLNGRISSADLDAVETLASTVLVSAYALLITVIVQGATGNITSFNASILLCLILMNNTITLIWMLLYLHHLRGLGHLAQGWRELYKNISDHFPSFPISSFAATPTSHQYRLRRWFIPLLGSIHLSLVGGTGIWLWSDPRHFGWPMPCDTFQVMAYSIFGHSVQLFSPSLSISSIVFFSTMLLPVVNLLPPLVLFISFYRYIPEDLANRLCRRLQPPKNAVFAERDKTSRIPTLLGLGIIGVFLIVMITDIELSLKKNSPLLTPSSPTGWSFGQVLSLVMLSVSIWCTVECVRDRPNQIRRREFSAMLYCILEGHPSCTVIRTLIELGANVNTWRTDSGYFRSALQVAIYDHDLDLIKLLLSKGANINDPPGKYGTSIGCAMIQGNQEILDLLWSINRQDNEEALSKARATGILESRLIFDWVMARGDIHDIELLCMAKLDSSGGLLSAGESWLGSNLNCGLHDALKKKKTGDIHFLIKYGKNLDDLQVVSVGNGTSDGASPHGNVQNRRMPSFQCASLCNNTIAMKELLKQGANIDQRDDDGYTAVERACQDAVSAIEKLANVLSSFFSGTVNKNPLENERVSSCMSAYNQCFETALVLLENGADIGGDHCHHIARFLSILISDLSSFLLRKGFLEEHVSWISSFFSEENKEKIVRLLDQRQNQKDAQGWLPSHLAAAHGKSSLMKILKERVGIDALNVIDSSGWSLLHLAVKGLHFDIATDLLGWGANAELLAPSGLSCLHLAIECNSKGGIALPKMIQLLAPRFLFSSINCRDPQKRTPLHTAAQKRNHRAAEELLRQGAKATLTDEYGRLPLHYSAILGDTDTARVLFKAAGGAKALNTPDAQGMTPLHLAIQNSHTPLVAMLLDFKPETEDDGVDVNLPGRDGLTALHFAVLVTPEKDKQEIVTRLLQCPGLRLDIQCKLNGWLPIHLAANGGNTTAVDQLLKQRGGVNKLTRCGKTALHIAFETRNCIRRRRRAVIDILKAHKATAAACRFQCSQPCELCVKEATWEKMESPESTQSGLTLP